MGNKGPGDQPLWVCVPYPLLWGMGEAQDALNQGRILPGGC